MARGKKKRREKREQKNLTTMAFCCANYMYCDTINDLLLLNNIKQEVIRLHESEKLPTDLAQNIISNLSRRIVCIKGNRRINARIYY